MLFAVLALFAWSSLAFCIRAALRDAPLLKTTAVITTCNGLLVAPVALSSVPLVAFWPSWEQTFFLLVAVALFMVALSRLSYYFAIRRIGPSRTIPIATSTPFVTACIAAIWLGEPVTLRILLGLGFLVAGVTAVVRADPAMGGRAGGYSQRDRLLGYLSAAATTLNWGATGVMLKAIALDVPPVAAAAMVIWVGILFAWVIHLLFGPSAGPVRIPRKNWSWIFGAAICQTAAIPSFSAALARTLAVNVTAITSLQPLLVMLIAHLFVRETENVTPRLVLGGSMTLGGTLLVLL